ncbi:MAG: hypothetical protein L0H83_03070 [Salinisphaera sp.]|nr:hypothetical protein [Salinisphaera sp.]
MEIDPIVEETRRLREEYAARFNNDTQAILEDILKRQEQHKERLVRFPPRKPGSTRGAA